MNVTADGIIYLLACAANGVAPASEKVGSIDLEELFRQSRQLSVSAAVGVALDKGGLCTDLFRQAINLSVRKTIILDTESRRVLGELEKHGIWYLPLKGAVLKKLYPQFGMREMADIDILYDKSRQKDVKDIMLALGFAVDHYDYANNDIYIKPPYVDFEMHMEFTPRSEKNNFADYYSGFERNFIKDTDNGYGYHLSDNDFYVFLTAHEYKHFSQSGTGIRSLLDCYIFLKAKGDLLDWDYIREQTDIMGITGFEQRRRNIAFKIFSDPDRRELDGAEREMLDRYLENGTYGSLENNIRNELEYQSKPRFYKNRIFLSREKMAQSVPFTKKSVLLYPAGFVVRAFRILLFKKRRMIRIVKAVNKYGK